MPSLLSSLRTAREYVTPTLKSSAFLTKGVLTPEEFIAAGDELVFKCPTWSWESGELHVFYVCLLYKGCCNSCAYDMSHSHHFLLHYNTTPL